MRAGVAVDYLYGNKSGALWTIYKDVVVMDGVSVSVDTVKIPENVYLINKGNISSDVFVDAGTVVYLQNSGVMSGNVYLASDAILYQVIKSNDDITKLNVESGKYILYIDNVNGLNLGDVVENVSDCRNIVLENSHVIWSDGLKYLNVEFVGDVLIDLSNVDLFLEEPIINNVAGVGGLTLVSSNLNSMYVLETSLQDGAVFAKLVRETDYTKIFNNETGVFLNNLRTDGIDRKFMDKMDVVSNMHEMKHLMKQSVRFSPNKMMNPVGVFNVFEMMAQRDDAMSYTNGAGVFYIGANDFDIYAIRANAIVNVNDALSIVASVYGGVLEFVNDINEYSGVLYGTSFGLNYDTDFLFVHGALGVSVANFDIGPVIVNNKTTENPSGFSWYGMLDAGHKFEIDSRFYVAPFAGVNFDSLYVSDLGKDNIALHLGTDFGVSNEIMGLRYDYGIRVFADSVSRMHTYLRIGVTSVEDMAGIEAGVGLVKDDLYSSYKISIGGHLSF